MKYLVDTNVLSEPTKARPDRAVVEWLRRREADVVVSCVVLGELQYGILLLPAGQKRKRLSRWFSEGAARLPTLDFDAPTAEVWAKLLARLKRNGKAMPIKDSLVAAIAKRHGLTVATRNFGDFEHAGVKLVNPFPA